MSTFVMSDDVYSEVLRLANLYHRQAEKCQDAKAYLAGCIMMGASLEALLLSFANCYPRAAAKSPAAPRKKGAVKPLIEWTLANLLAVAKERNWLPSALSTDEEWDDAKAQIGDYGEVVKEIRNLVHPARYAIDMPHKRITKKYLEASLNIVETACDYLLDRINESLRKAVEGENAKNA
jgi:hypothetical protein